MDALGYILPFVYLVFLESLMVRWISGNPVPNLVSRIIATNLCGLALLLLVSMTGWFFGWWPEIRNWALRDSFFLFLVVKFPLSAFLFRRWGIQKIFTLHVLGNFVSVVVLSMLFVYSPGVLGIKPITADDLKAQARSRILEIRDAVEDFKFVHNYYPDYLWGGDMVSWGPGVPPDPLLKEGYLAAYPVNPLNLRKTYFEPRREAGLKELWFGYKSDDFLHTRDLWQPVTDREPRFGFRGTKMGNVLPDPRNPATKLTGDVRFSINAIWLPGGFFYRSFDLDNNGYADAYIMGVCGDERAQATVDCYDARVDALTRIVDGRLVPSAHDHIRDGVFYIIRQGFPQTSRVGGRVPVPILDLLINPETGELIPQSITPNENTSAGNTESAVTQDSGGGENGDGETGNVGNGGENGDEISSGAGNGEDNVDEGPGDVISGE
jgi:hypothetical protein